MRLSLNVFQQSVTSTSVGWAGNLTRADGWKWIPVPTANLAGKPNVTPVFYILPACLALHYDPFFQGCITAGISWFRKRFCLELYRLTNGQDRWECKRVTTAPHRWVLSRENFRIVERRRWTQSKSVRKAKNATWTPNGITGYSL